jgi:hypothetical protein
VDSGSGCPLPWNSSQAAWRAGRCRWHASRIRLHSGRQAASRESGRSPPIRRSLFASENTFGPPNDSLPPASKQDVGSDRAYVLPVTTPFMRRACRGLTALQSVAPASRDCLLSGLSPVLTDEELRTVGVNYRGEIPNRRGPERKGHPVVNRTLQVACMQKCMRQTWPR